MTGSSTLVRVNFLLAIVLIVSGLYLVKVSYESRRLFSEIDNANTAARQLESDRRRLDAERQAQATHLRVESVASTKLGMHAATPGNTQYIVDAGLAAAPVNAPLVAAPQSRPSDVVGGASGADAGASR